VHEQIQVVANGAEAVAKQAGQSALLNWALGGLGIGGPVGMALLLGRFLIQRSSHVAGIAGVAKGNERVIAIDTPPPPQRVVPETHYVPYEQDQFAKAHQWAGEQLVRKYPGSVDWLMSLDSLIKQQLAGET
jgi:hypothetical protein